MKVGKTTFRKSDFFAGDGKVWKVEAAEFKTSDYGGTLDEERVVLALELADPRNDDAFFEMNLPVGSADDYTITEDGDAFEPRDANVGPPHENCKFAQFVSSLEDAGYPGENASASEYVGLVIEFDKTERTVRGSKKPYAIYTVKKIVSSKKEKKEEVSDSDVAAVILDVLKSKKGSCSREALIAALVKKGVPQSVLATAADLESLASLPGISVDDNLISVE